MKLLALALFVMAACQFDGAGLGARGTGSTDAATADAPFGAADAARTDAAPGTPDARPIVDATIAPPDATIGVACDNATCAVDQFCCVTFAGGGQQYACANNCNGNNTLSYECDGPEDCGSDDCCLDNGGGGSRCRNSCGIGQQLTCRSDADCPNNQNCCDTGIGNIQACRVVCF